MMEYGFDAHPVFLWVGEVFISALAIFGSLVAWHLRSHPGRHDGPGWELPQERGPDIMGWYVLGGAAEALTAAAADAPAEDGSAPSGVLDPLPREFPFRSAVR